METNLSEIRDICKCLLNLPIDEKEGFFLAHPYFEQTQVPLSDGATDFEFIDTTTLEGYKQAVDFWEERIDKMDLIPLFMTIRKQYRLLLFKLSHQSTLSHYLSLWAMTGAAVIIVATTLIIIKSGYGLPLQRT